MLGNILQSHTYTTCPWQMMVSYKPKNNTSLIGYHHNHNNHNNHNHHHHHHQHGSSSTMGSITTYTNPFYSHITSTFAKPTGPYFLTFCLPSFSQFINGSEKEHSIILQTYQGKYIPSTVEHIVLPWISHLYQHSFHCTVQKPNKKHFQHIFRLIYKKGLLDLH